MEFEYDPQKSLSNKQKHGVTFEEAVDLWNDPFVIEVPIKGLDEERHMVIGKLNHKIWSAIITYRGNKVRLISVRRSREDEVNHYEKN